MKDHVVSQRISVSVLTCRQVTSCRAGEIGVSQRLCLLSYAGASDMAKLQISLGHIIQTGG